MSEDRPEDYREEEDRREDGPGPQEGRPPSEESPLPEEPGPDERLVSGSAATSTEDGTAQPEVAEPVPAAEPISSVVPAESAVLATERPEPTVERPQPSRRRLMRSRDHRIIAGVAGGIAGRFDTDPGLIRVLFLVLAIFTAGLAAIVYAVLWVSMPLGPGGPAAPATEDERRQRAGDRRIGGLVFGLLLVLAGVTWLLQATDSVDVDWGVVLAVTLMGLGALLVLTLGSVARGPLIAFGVLLTAALAVVSLVDINFESSFGDRTEEPASVADLHREYSHAFGSMTLDLSTLDLPEGTTRVKASTSFGSLEIVLPPGVAVRIDAETTFGSIDALDNEASGAKADRILTDSNYDAATSRLELEIDVAFGSVEVRR